MSRTQSFPEGDLTTARLEVCPRARSPGPMSFRKWNTSLVWEMSRTSRIGFGISDVTLRSRRPA